ncbi:MULTISPECIES: SDR family oxidoreductase [Nonlabens]|uniref:Uncharacterized protein YbjT (DUF2867 family) n=1 Tax=Nonlabens xylanidelens TaxID=191564 RepID=A0A2S6IEF1_9FLAO|nr:SDR family oxidoreductase [Nonlabens xylanidelens]PPK92566.1 uncharacterized protein YbjT (DUF2867 family) [Nonlabens xylanidelens]PQJ22029.1 NAD-dependent dehydratase [Nonlabens xylanidelens]
MEKVLVAGATGTTGKQIVNLLNESQYFEPVAMIRKEEQKAQFEAQNVKWVMGDLSQDISHTFKNIDKVIFAAGSGGKKVVEIDQEGAKKVVDGAITNDIKKFVMLSSMGADNPEEADQLVEYLKAKHNADVYLKNSGLNYTIVRPGSLINDNASNHIELSHKLNKHGEISRADVAQTLTRALHDDTANKETFEIIKGDTLISKALDTMSTATV